MSGPGFVTDDAHARWPKGLLALVVMLTAAAPLAMYSGRIPGLGEFDYQIYYRLLFYNDLSNSLAMIAALLLALLVSPLRQWIERLAEWMSLHPLRTCGYAFVMFAVCARIVYQGFPLAMDEYASLFQARIFASGDVAATYPRELLDHMVVPGFQGFFILVNHDTGQAASAYWPGLALLMTPFALFGGEWLLNPLLGAAGLWLAGDLAKRATGQVSARGWAVMAALASPQYTVNAISFYAMSGLLTLSLLYIWLLMRNGYRSALFAGVVGSLALVLHNPLPHALVAAPCIVWLLSSKERRARLLPLVAGYLPLTGLLCVGWPLLTSHMGLRQALGNPDIGFVASWLERLQAIFSLPNIDTLRIRSYAAWKAMIWTAPGLLVIALVAGPRTTIQRLMLASLLLTFFFYFLFPLDQGHGWGYRYLHPAWGLVPVAIGVLVVSKEQAGNVRTLAAAAVAAGIVATPVFMLTTRATISTSIAQQIPQAPRGNSIIFIDASRPALYTVDLVRNYPHEQSSTIRMMSSGSDADEALALSIAGDAKVSISDHRGTRWDTVKSLSPQKAETPVEGLQ